MSTLTKQFLEKAYELYQSNKTTIPKEYIHLITEDVLALVSNDIKAFYFKSQDIIKQKERKATEQAEHSLKVIEEVESRRNETEKLVAEVQEANERTRQVNLELEDALLKLQEQKKITEEIRLYIKMEI